jgi:hypothetical protein
MNSKTCLEIPQERPFCFKTMMPSVLWLGLLMGVALLLSAKASDNVPMRPFAMWADVPLAGQFVIGGVYEESEAYHMWAHGNYANITAHANGESYGNDINQGYLSLQYGITERWAADLNIGYTSMGWRFFDGGKIQSTSGLMDVSFGLRYQLFSEAEAQSPWIPTLTFRAGAVVPGTYSEHFIFAPGLRSEAIVPEVLVRKHLGWPGLGAYGDALFRWNHTTGNNQYIIAVGAFQQIKGWELDFGYRHLQFISGTDISYPVDPEVNNGLNIIYPRDPREIYDAIEAGFSYTTSKRLWRYGFHLLSIVDGNNTDAKLWVGASMDVPIGGKKKAQEINRVGDSDEKQ